MDSTSLLEKVKGKYIISSVEKVSNVLDDRKEAVVTTPFSENKLLTKYVNKGDG